jgi:hypothetical protein
MAVADGCARVSQVRDEVLAGADYEPWLADAFPCAEELGARISLEVRKQGAVVDTLALGATPRALVGKHSTCAVQLDHPSISRRHGASRTTAPAATPIHIGRRRWPTPPSAHGGHPSGHCAEPSCDVHTRRACQNHECPLSDAPRCDG